MKQLTKHIFVETGFHSANLGCIVTDEGVVLIDAPFRPTDAMIWRKEVQRKGQIKYLINTEAHGDHHAGDFFFPVPVIAHEKTRETIVTEGTKLILERIAAIDPEGLPLVSNYKLNAPAITFSETLTLHLGKHTFQLIWLPGHTPGQTAVLISEEKVLFTGDNVTYKTQGFLHYADPVSWLKSLKKIEKLDFEYLVPGHGEVCDKSYLSDQYSYVEECIHTIKKAIDRGWTKEEALERVSVPRRYSLSAGLEVAGPIMLKQSVGRLYDMLSREGVSI